jgi:transcriptional regulator with XRE-family HTH domain
MIRQSLWDKVDQSLTWRIADRIRRRRVELGFSQERFADVVGIPQPNLSRIEAGIHRPQRKTVVRMAAALRVEPEELDQTTSP